VRVAVPVLLVAAVVAVDALVYVGADNGWIGPFWVGLVGVLVGAWVTAARDRRSLTVRAIVLLVTLIVMQPVAFYIWADSVPWD
jgi:hypothetical protein